MPNDYNWSAGSYTGWYDSVASQSGGSAMSGTQAAAQQYQYNTTINNFDAAISSYAPNPWHQQPTADPGERRSAIYYDSDLSRILANVQDALEASAQQRIFFNIHKKSKAIKRNLPDWF